MSQRIESQSLLPADRSNAFPQITNFFDGAIYIIERCGDVLEELGRLLLKSKLFVVGLALVILVTIELYLFIRYLISGAH